MTVTLREVSSHYPAAAGCDALYEVSAPGLGIIAVIALHDLSAGPGVGGVRRRRYPSLGAAVVEAAALAEQMTLKTSLADLPVGGAMATLVDRDGLDLAAAYELLGRAVEQLGGAFLCGADAGTGATELDWLRRGTTHVNRVSQGQATSTAAGVIAACEAALHHLGADPGAGFRALVQGIGATGREIALGLARKGARLALADVDPERPRGLAAELEGAEIVAPEDALAQDVAIFAPCAVGAPIAVADIERMRMKIVCGAANQQLREPCVALELDAAGILYVPDFAANAGAVIEGVVSWLGEKEPGGTAARVADAVGAIGPRVAEILADAAANDCTPLEAALDRIGRPGPDCR
ncbi:MAG: hypothetical protein KC635_20395 [Myxococcales bacterium]|nr:hypothetical protein [Myxococcales bacterium]MCB9733778.1 hypothetical protein [Deltaproteobacteria bacterium]